MGIMKCTLFRDRSSRERFLSEEATRLSLKILFFDARLTIGFRLKVGALYKRLHCTSGSRGIKNRCFLSKKSFSTARNFRLSRIAFRNKVLFGQLLGVIKKSW